MMSNYLTGKIKTSGGYNWNYIDWVKPEKINTEGWEYVRENPDYVVSRDGRFVHKKTQLLIKTQESNGYNRVTLGSKPKGNKHTYSVQRLVTRAYSGDPLSEKHQANHKDGNKQNNNIDNLEWLTQSGNILHSYETGLNNCRIPVCQYTVTGEKIATYKSLSDASKETGITRRHISECCSKENSAITAGGSIWRYIDEDFSSQRTSRDNRKILCSTRDGEFINIYDSVAEIYKETGYAKQNIYYNLKGKGNTAFGMKWKYISEDEAKNILDNNNCVIEEAK